MIFHYEQRFPAFQVMVLSGTLAKQAGLKLMVSNTGSGLCLRLWGFEAKPNGSHTGENQSGVDFP